jgi:hypothetical protein
MKNKKNVFLAAFIALSIVFSGAAFAQEDGEESLAVTESTVKSGITVRTELRFGNVLKDWHFLGSGDKPTDYKKGNAQLILPRVDYTNTAGKWTFKAQFAAVIKDRTVVVGPMGEKITSWEMSNFLGQAIYQFTPEFSASLKGGDGDFLTPAVAYSIGNITLSLDVPFNPDGGLNQDGDQTWFGGSVNKSYLAVMPGIDFADKAIGINAWATWRLSILNDSSYISDGANDDGWNKYKSADNDALLGTVELNVNYTVGPLYVELWGAIPAYKDGIKNAGIRVIPIVQYEVVKSLKVYGGADITSIASDSNVGVNPRLGVKYSF